MFKSWSAFQAIAVKARLAVLVATVAVAAMAPGAAAAQSAGCARVNAGSLDHFTTYGSGDLNASNARYSNTTFDQAANMIRITASTDQAFGTAAYDTTGRFAFAAGDVLSMTVVGENVTAGTITPRFRYGTNAVSASDDMRTNVAVSAEGTQASAYTITGFETSIGVRTVKNAATAPTGTVRVTVTCTPATPAPTISSFTYGSIVAYNEGSNQTTAISLAVGGNVQNNPTSYAVGSATTVNGGSVSVDSSGQATYTPPVGFRGNDSFTWTATNGSGTSTPATTTVSIGDPTFATSLTGSGVWGTALSGVMVSIADGHAPYNCATSVASGALPAGVSIASNCALTGTPAASGTFNFTVNVTDSSTGTGPYTQASGTLTLVVAAPTLTLSPAAGALPGATAAAAYSQTFTAGAGSGPYGYRLTAGALPTGLTLTGGTVSGTPTEVGTFNFTLTATDSSSAGSGGPYVVARSYSITVSPPVIALAPTTLPSGTVSSAYSQAVSASGGVSTYAYAVTAGALPNGLTLNGSTGVISGTPIQHGAFTFTLTATDSTTGAGAPYSGSRAYTLSIAPPTITLSPSNLPNATIGAAYSRTLSASGGAGNYTYVVTSGSLAPGLTLSPAGAITGTPTGAGAWNFTITATDGTLTQYSGSAAYTLAVNAPTITVSPTSLPGATVGAAYSQALSAAGGTAGYSYAVTGGSLPAGLSLSGAGVLSGTPTAGGTFNFTLTATDSSTGTGAPFAGAQAYSMIVAAPAVVIAPTSLPNGRAGAAYSQTLAASGGTGPYTYTVTAGALPPGWTLSAAGVLSGTATESNAFNFTVTAVDSSTGSGAPYSSSRAYTVNVFSPAFTLTGPTLSASVGQAYSGSFVASGGTTPYTYYSSAGTLPPGLTLAGNGTLSGTPTASGTFNFTVIAWDSTTGPGSPFAVGSGYTFTVVAPTLVLAPATLANGVVGAGYAGSVSASGGVSPYIYTVTAGALPPGVTLNPATGTLGGVPTANGTFNFTLTATDSATGAGAPFSVSRAYAVAIGPGSQTITFGTLPNASLSVSPQTLSATASSGLSVTFASDTPAICSVSGTTLTLLQTGTCTIRAEQAGDASWAAAPIVSQSFTVTPAVLAIAPGTAAGLQVGMAYSQTNTASGGVGPYTYSLGTGAFVPGTTINPSTGVVSGTPTVAGSFSYIVRATDGQPLSVDTAVTTVAIARGVQTIAFTSTAPSAVVAGPAYGVSASSTSGLGVAFTVDGTSTGCVISGSSVTFTAPGTCVINADQPGDSNWNPAARVQQSFTVIANPPIAANVSGVAVAYGSGGTAIDLSGSLTGAAHASIAIAIATAPAHGTVSVSGDVATYTPAPTYFGADSFTFTATGPGGTSNVATVSLTVATPATPVAADRAGVTVPWNSPGTAIDLSASITGVRSAITIGAPPSHGTVTVAGEVATYAPAAGYYGPDSFTFTATGPGGTSNVATVSLSVGTPPAPIAANISGVAVPWNSGGTAIDLSASITGVHSSIAITSAPAHGTMTISGDVVTYTPASGYYGADSFTYTAAGPGGVSAPAAVSLTVATPAAPTVTAVTGMAVPYASTGTAIPLQPSGVYTSLSVASAPAHGAVTVSGTTATYTPAAEYFGADSFTYTATGPGGASAPATVSLAVATPPPPAVTPPGVPIVVPPSPVGPAQPVTVSLGDQTTGKVDGFRITTTARFGTASITMDTGATLTANAVSRPGSAPQAVAGGYRLVYSPAANFMGSDAVTVVAYGPGGDSAPLTFTFQVAGKAPDLTGQAPSNGSVTFSPTSSLVGGPFQGVRIVRAPGFGTAAINGLDIVFTPGAANGGSTSLDYVVDLPFGGSAAGRIALVSNLVPGQLALTATTVQGRPVTTRISDGQGGPFTGATVVSVSPSTAGTATIAGAGGVYDLTFTPSGAFSGTATVNFTLTNAAGTTASTLVVTVEARPDPALDAEVRGVASSQVTSARRFTDAQINNFQRRLQDLHDGTNRSSNGASLNLGFGAQGDADNDPRTALRRQVSGGRDMVDPDDGGVDRERDMLGLDLWVGRQTAAHAADSGAKGLSAASASNETGDAPALGFWTAGSVDWGRQDARGQRDYRFTTQGVTAGVDMRLNDQLIVGAGLGYGEDKTRIGGNGSVSNGSGLTGALYASWRPAGTFYVDGVVGWSDLDFRSRRWSEGLGSDPDAYASGDRSGDARFLTASFGRVVRSEALSSQLYARVDARSISLNGFTETGAGLASLIWDGVDQESLTANLGASLRWWMEHRRLGVLRPSVRVEWSHEFEDIGAQGVRYADWVASPSYLVPLDAWSRDTLRLDLGGEWSLTDRFMISLGYRGMLGDASTSHGLDITLKYGW